MVKYILKPILSGALAVLGAASTATAIQHDHGAATEGTHLFSGLGHFHHPVSTRTPEAQRFFDQGFILIYAFNHEEAVRSFQRAADLDPSLAMAYWGIALALGPNINLDVDPDREKAAYDAEQKALALAAKASENEQAYIQALSKRYSTDPKADLKALAVDYKNAMGELSRRFPNDLDAATLFAESAMDLKPWQLWTAEGNPAEGTPEIIAVLESVLKRDSNHIGANHYYIHAVEASPHPERALASADKLTNLVPAAGHLVHMPAHIYMRTGDYEGAARANEVGATADQAYIKGGGQGMYPMMYYSHNLHFLAIARSMQGNYAETIKAAKQLEDNVAPHVKEAPMLESFLSTSLLMKVRFHKWTEVLREPEPDAALPITTAFWHFARGMGHSAESDITGAESELAAFKSCETKLQPDATFGLNPAKSVTAIAEHVLAARIAQRKGGRSLAIAELEKAVAAEDALAYDEPPGWYMPVRETLGAMLLVGGDAAGAEKIFRADLAQHPHSGRSLFGLAEALDKMGNKAAAVAARKEYQGAWKNADTQLRIAEM